MATCLNVSCKYVRGVLLVVVLFDAVRLSAASALHRAVITNNMPALTQLLAGRSLNLLAAQALYDEPTLSAMRAFDFNIQDGNGSTALHLAARYANRAAVLALLKAGVKLELEDNDGKIPFTHAADNALNSDEHAVVAAILLQAMVGVNGQDEKGWTPLGWAILSGDWQLVQEFIREGADTRAGSQDAWNVAQLMASEGQLIESLVAENANAIVDKHNRTVMMLVAKAGDTEKVRMLIKKGGVINARSYFGETALILAAAEGHNEIVRILIEHDADPNVQGLLKRTALIEAAEEGHTKIVEMLIEHNANLDLVDKWRETALMRAVVKGHTDIVRILIEHDADPNVTGVLDATGTTALILAVIGGHTEIAEMLIDYNATDLDLANWRKETALMQAVQKGHTDIVRMLIEHDADPNVKADMKMTALMLAAIGGHTEIAEMLIKHGADPNAKDFYGLDALDYAEPRNHVEIVAMLRAAQQAEAEAER